MRGSIYFCLTAILLGFMAPAVYGDTPEENWPAWRGPNFDGEALHGNPPLEWSETKNVKWKVKLPGSGGSTPVVWGNKILLTTAEPSVGELPKQPRGNTPLPAPAVPYKFNILCLDRETGKVLWERTANEAIPHEGHHPTGSYASYSPVTDGAFVWASFGSWGLHCFSLDGEHRWSADLIKMTTVNTFGEGSSVALAGDAVIVVMDHEGDSKIFAFDKTTGAPLWTKDRDEKSSWATPLIIEHDGVEQVVTSGSNRIRSYNTKTGDIIWEHDGLNDDVIPSPVVGLGNIYLTSGYRNSNLYAIKLGGTGDLSDSGALVWQTGKDTPYVSSPLIYDGKIYFTRGLSGYISCYDAATGKPFYTRQKLQGLRQLYASPVGAAGRIYIPGRRGTTVVIKSGERFEILATNVLDDGFDASPVVAGDELFLKGLTSLYCIARP